MEAVMTIFFYGIVIMIVAFIAYFVVKKAVKDAIIETKNEK